METNTVKRGIMVIASLTLFSFLISIMVGRKLSEAVLATTRIGFILLVTLLLLLAYDRRAKNSKMIKLQPSMRYFPLILIISGVWMLADLILYEKLNLELIISFALITIFIPASPFLLRLLRFEDSQLSDITIQNLIKLIVVSTILSLFMGGIIVLFKTRGII